MALGHYFGFCNHLRLLWIRPRRACLPTSSSFSNMEDLHLHLCSDLLWSLAIWSPKWNQSFFPDFYRQAVLPVFRLSQSGFALIGLFFFFCLVRLLQVLGFRVEVLGWSKLRSQLESSPHEGCYRAGDQAWLLITIIPGWLLRINVIFSIIIPLSIFSLEIQMWDF